jgi:hypothetical protein
MGIFGPSQGTLTEDTISVGMRVRIHYYLQDSMTGVVESVSRNGRWANVSLDGYDGKLIIEALISECDEIA